MRTPLKARGGNIFNVCHLPNQKKKKKKERECDCELPNWAARDVFKIAETCSQTVYKWHLGHNQ